MDPAFLNKPRKRSRNQIKLKKVGFQPPEYHSRTTDPLMQTASIDLQTLKCIVEAQIKKKIIIQNHCYLIVTEHGKQTYIALDCSRLNEYLYDINFIESKNCS